MKKLAIRDAGGKGLGVMATRRIQAGTVLVGYYGKSRWIWDIPISMREYCFQMDYDKYAIPRRGSIGWYLNHSCEPNCIIRGKRRIAAWRDIEIGEEVTFDYSTNVGWEPYEMKCLCGAKSCRRVVRSYAHLDPSDKRRYGENISRYLIAGRIKTVVNSSG
jgi:uncharacterized protein